MIDAHVHVWTLDAARYPWQPTLAHVPIPTAPATAETLIAEMDAAGVSHAVLVQPSVYGWNNDYVCDCLRRWPDRFVGVCLVDPRAADAAERLEFWVRERGCRGLRINIIADRDAGWLLEPARDGLWQAARRLDISVAFQMLPAHAGTVATLAMRHPDIAFIADYLGAAAFHDGSGITAIDRFAGLPNLWYKVQALGSDSRRPYPFDDLWPLYTRAVERLGTYRLVFGTDFPHIYQACSYAEGSRWLDTLPFLDSAARTAIGDANARFLWRIPATSAGTGAG
jgi:predicted TIM-barrel fold metal-dependent hydrolase